MAGASNSGQGGGRKLDMKTLAKFNQDMQKQLALDQKGELSGAGAGSSARRDDDNQSVASRSVCSVRTTRAGSKVCICIICKRKSTDP